jgi:large subunit ribosomal protein L17
MAAFRPTAWLGMKHGVGFRKLNRTTKHRKALLRNMVTQLITHEQIRTTLPKAKELRRVADQMVTLGKKGDLAARRKAAGYVRDKKSLTKLFAVLAPRYEERTGGYTRVLRDGNRYGDNAPMAYIEYVDRPGELRPRMLKEEFAQLLEVAGEGDAAAVEGDGKQ